MTTYADSINYYDRYTHMTKEAVHARFDTVFGAHVTDDQNLEVSDLQLLQYLYSIANDDEKKALKDMTQDGLNMYDLWGSITTDPVFKKNLVPMLSQAALQEAREPGSSYVYHNPSARTVLYRPQYDVYKEEMPFHNPQATLQMPFVRRIAQNRAVPRTVKIMTEPTPGLTAEAISKGFAGKDGFTKNKDGIWVTDNKNAKLSDLEAMQIIYSMADDKEKEYLNKKFKERGGYSTNMLLADMARDPDLRNNLLGKLSEAAQLEAGETALPAIWRNPGMYNFYRAQNEIYDRKLPFKKTVLGNSWLRWPVDKAPGVGIKAQTRKAMTEKDKNLSFANIQNTADQTDTWDPITENRNGGGDIEYVAPALAVGAPLALLGGMQGGLGAGIGLLGLAGLAGYGYGYGKSRGWKGWEWADKAGDKINGMFSGKPATTQTAPKVPKPTEQPTAPTP